MWQLVHSLGRLGEGGGISKSTYYYLALPQVGGGEPQQSFVPDYPHRIWVAK